MQGLGNFGILRLGMFFIKFVQFFDFVIACLLISCYNEHGYSFLYMGRSLLAQGTAFFVSMNNPSSLIHNNGHDRKQHQQAAEK